MPADDAPIGLTIIVPAYNEEQRLPATLDQMAPAASARPGGCEVLVVVNGCTDRTADVVRDYAARYPAVRLATSARGKGNAIKAGVAAARGTLVYFCDADLSTPFAEAERLIAPVARGECDVAIGSREGVTAKRLDEPAYRHLVGRAFNWMVRGLVVPGIRDTQCGFKCFRRDDARRIFAAVRTGGWAFDVEALFLARRFGLRICEVPVTWRFDANTRISVWRDSLEMARDVVAIRLRALLGRYPR